MNAKDVLDEEISRAVLMSGDAEVSLYFARERGRPIPARYRVGAWLEHLSDDKREAIRSLTSDETRSYRDI